MTYEPKPETYIPIDQCVVGALYQVSARNFNIGIYRGGNDNCFVGIREKFGKKRLDNEDHWDNGPPYGTVKPLKCIEQSHFTDLSYDAVYGADAVCDENYNNIFAWLEAKEKEYPAE